MTQTRPSQYLSTYCLEHHRGQYVYGLPTGRKYIVGYIKTLLSSYWTLNRSLNLMLQPNTREKETERKREGERSRLKLYL